MSMIFKYIFDNEISPQDTLLLSLYDLGALSTRQFCTLTGWTPNKFWVTISRIRKAQGEDWVISKSTKYHLDRYYYILGRGGLRYCGKLLRKKVSLNIINEFIVQNRHILGLNEILVRLVESGVDRRKIVWLSTKEATDFLYRLYRHHDPGVEKKDLLRPDARLVIEPHDISAWIEYDNSTEGPLQIEQKYIRYIETLEALSKRDPVIWVARDKMRKQYLENIWESLRRLNYRNHWVPKMYFFSAGEEVSYFIKE